jgi:hypothetical protein
MSFLSTLLNLAHHHNQQQQPQSQPAQHQQPLQVPTPDSFSPMTAAPQQPTQRLQAQHSSLLGSLAGNLSHPLDLGYRNPQTQYNTAMVEGNNYMQPLQAGAQNIQSQPSYLNQPIQPYGY